MNQYCFKGSFSADPTLSQQLFQLLETVFPGITQTAEYISALGTPWEDASTPFIRFQGDSAVTHVGVLELPLVIMGQKVTVGGIHAVCTHPEFRRRGYYRQVMEEVLQYCATRYETLILTTAQPELYAPFGFRVVEEHAFVAKCSSAVRTSGFRLLNLQDPEDKQLLHRLLREREPVSQVVGIVNETAVFCFNESTRPLYYAEDLDIIVCIEIAGTQLKLFDVVGTKICPLSSVIERISQPIDEVVIYFTPDCLDAETQAFPDIFEGDSLLMIRGSFPAEGQPFILPRSARC